MRKKSKDEARKQKEEEKEDEKFKNVFARTSPFFLVLLFFCISSCISFHLLLLKIFFTNQQNGETLSGMLYRKEGKEKEKEERESKVEQDVRG